MCMRERALLDRNRADGRSLCLARAERFWRVRDAQRLSLEAGAGPRSSEGLGRALSERINVMYADRLRILLNI